MPNMRMDKNPMPEQCPNVRNKNFLEVTTGYTEEMAIDEAQRCLNCKHKPCMQGCPVSVKIPELIIDKANGKVAIFEVKYSQSMKQLNKDCDKALAQMKERKYAEDYKDRYKDIFCYGISFYKKECLVKMLES